MGEDEDPLPPAGSSGTPDFGESPDVVTIRAGVPWSFWALVALGVWWVFNELDGHGRR